jgi:hypothetical protein
MVAGRTEEKAVRMAAKITDEKAVRTAADGILLP